MDSNMLTFGNFTFHKLSLDGLVVIESKRFSDDRGYFMETYKESEFARGGVSSSWVQENSSASQKGVLRGLHYQQQNPQAKLVIEMINEEAEAIFNAQDEAVELEGKIIDYWRSANFKVAHNIPSLFTHKRLDR